MKKRIKSTISSNSINYKHKPNVANSIHIDKDTGAIHREFTNWPLPGNDFRIVGLNKKITKKSYICMKFSLNTGDCKSHTAYTFNTVCNNSGVYTWWNNFVKQWNGSVVNNTGEVVSIIEDDGKINSAINIIVDIVSRKRYPINGKNINEQILKSCINDYIVGIVSGKNILTIANEARAKFGVSVSEIVRQSIDDYKNIGNNIEDIIDIDFVPRNDCFGIDTVLSRIEADPDTVFSIEIVYKHGDGKNMTSNVIIETSKNTLSAYWEKFVEMYHINPNSIKNFTVRPTDFDRTSISIISKHMSLIIEELIDNNIIDDTINDGYIIDDSCFVIADLINKYEKYFGITVVRKEGDKWIVSNKAYSDDE